MPAPPRSGSTPPVARELRRADGGRAPDVIPYEGDAILYEGDQIPLKSLLHRAARHHSMLAREFHYSSVLCSAP